MAIIGGGSKKVLYTLNSVRRIGLLSSAKALSAKNTCKACGLGMGGQRGGMTNELDEFPSVCNKSVQAQSTDIQSPIPSEIFSHTLAELKELSAHELEHLGRLARPIYKSADSDRFQEVEWDWALGYAAERFAATEPERSFFYSSGRSSNEAGFLLQLMARLYGTNNVSNCSYYCHQATGEALQNTIGSGTSTVELADIAGCDLFFLLGANPASNHPRLLHKLIQLRRRGGHVIVINPMKEAGLVKFAAPKMASSMIKGGDEIASEYLQPRIGSDIALMKAIAKAVIEKGAVAEDFVADYSHGYEALKASLAATSWSSLLDQCGVSREEITRVAELYCNAENTIFAWGMGMTHHRHGVENIEWISNLALLRGMVGKRSAGLLPLRGHSNVQGIGTIGVKPVLAEQVMQKIQQEFACQLPTAKGLHTLASLERARAGDMDAALMMGGNLYAATPDSTWAAEAMQRIDFKCHLTTTLNSGHLQSAGQGESLILPVCARDEEPEATTQESMFNYVRMSDGGIERIANVRAESAVLADIASQLLPDCGVNFAEFKSHRYVRDAIAKIVPGMEPLADIDVAKQEFYVRGRILHTPQFNTVDGRARFVLGESAAVPRSDTLPLTLMTLRSEGQFNSIIYEEHDSYRGIDSRWSVMLSQQDALQLGVNDGERVDMVSASGEMRGLQARIVDIAVGSVAAYYPEANVLCSRDSDPRSHTPAFKSVAVALRRAG